MRKIIFILLLLTSSLAHGQTYIKAHSLNYGVKQKDGDIGWIVENKPVDVQIIVNKGIFTVYSNEVQYFQLVEALYDGKDLKSWKCVDGKGISCVVFIKNDSRNNKFGIFGVDYSDRIYYYYSELEE